MSCNDCIEKLKFVRTIKCNYKDCDNTYEYAPYFMKMMGFNEPKKCEDHRKILEVTCSHCSSNSFVKYHEWLKNTNEGEFEYICQDCWVLDTNRECKNCFNYVETPVIFSRKYTKFLCNDCKSSKENSKVKCSTKGCKFTHKWFTAFNKYDEFSEKNEVFKCPFCVQKQDQSGIQKFEESKLNDEKAKQEKEEKDEKTPLGTIK